MVDIGFAFCPVCGAVDRKKYYRYANNHDGALLQKSSFGKYSLIPYATDGDLVTPQPPLKLVEIPPKGPTPNGIVVRGSPDSPQEYWERCCPNCEKHTVLPGEVGDYPTFVILLAGEEDTGKSSYLTSLSCNSVLPATIPGSDYWIEPWKARDEDDGPEKTTIDSVGVTSWFKIVTKEANSRKKKTWAMIVVRDFSGELFNQHPRQQELLGRFFTKKANYKPDAVMIFGSYHSQSAQVINAINQGHLGPYLSELPVAVVMTHLDELIGHAELPTEEKERAEQYLFTYDSNRKIIPLPLEQLRDLVTERGSFRDPLELNGSRMLEPEEFRKRVALEDALLRLLKHRNNGGGLESSGMATILSRNPGRVTKGFLIRARYGAEEGKFSYWDKPVNVFDPFLWILANTVNFFDSFRA